jgi:TnpA family transposase
LASQRLNPKLITQNWDDFLRVAGSIKMGKVGASELIRALQRGTKRSLLARALGELGRIPKTLHLLTFIDDPCYRRDILTQLNRGEGRHRLSRKCFHSQRVCWSDAYSEALQILSSSRSSSCLLIGLSHPVMSSADVGETLSHSNRSKRNRIRNTSSE